MGSIDTPKSEHNGSSTAATDADIKSSAGDGMPPPPTKQSNGTLTESEVSKKRKASMLPLEVGTRVMCRWRDGKYHPVKVIERRKLSPCAISDYEYYVHYTECE